MWHYVSEAGVIGYILVLLSLISIGVVFERLLFWWGQERAPTGEEQNQLVRSFSSEVPERLLAKLKKRRSPEARALAYLLEHRRSKDQGVLEVALSREVAVTDQNLGILEVIAGMAPMLGILGTVIGIIQAFGGMAGSSPDTAIMVTGISVSMLTTAIGLTVALISLVPHFVLSSKAHRRQTRLAELLQECWNARSDT